MKQSLQLRIGQQLTMTPQLQQAIRLLQLSTLDLHAEVQQAVESNPMLEIEDDDQDRDRDVESTDPYERSDAADRAAADAPDWDGGDGGDGGGADDDYTEMAGGSLDELGSFDAAVEFDGGADEVAGSDTDWDAHAIPEDLPVDSQWDDLFTGLAAPGSSGGDGEEYDNDSRSPAGETLQQHLAWQLNLLPLSALDRAIAEAIADSIDDDGLLRTPVEDIAAGFAPDIEVGADEVVAVLHMIQQFEPTGIAARDLRECLLLQLRVLPEVTPWRAEAIELVEDHFDLLAARDVPRIRQRLSLDEFEFDRVATLVRSLNPRPGRQFDRGQTEYVIPDVLVTKRRGRWTVELNPDAAPRVRVNPFYAAMVRRGDQGSDNQYLRNSLQEARWFIKSLQSRSETLLKVAMRIVERQRRFFDYGPEGMEPLVLADIAEAVGMHESTISRVTTRKYMHSPRGVFELKYFFSSHVATTTGGEASSVAIRALIRKLIATENPRKPLSDSKLSQILKVSENINVARRTVAKYRESLAIPPSNERKSLA